MGALRRLDVWSRTGARRSSSIRRTAASPPCPRRGRGAPTSGARIGRPTPPRFTRIDADTLLYEFTIDDPGTWTAPWTAQIPMRWNPLSLFEYACHEGNYAMPNILGGARLEERNPESGQD